ncbi:hypothetical protein BCEP4_2660008 [Burkholderia cepacia]|nr:hypothetical protein BCEP4_2660008 [Burkholderia cepacia]
MPLVIRSCAFPVMTREHLARTCGEFKLHRKLQRVGMVSAGITKSLHTVAARYHITLWLMLMIAWAAIISGRVKRQKN